MGILEKIGNDYRQRRAQLTGPESIATLEHMEDHFQDGANWTQHMYENASGARCLVAAANHVRVSPVDDAKHWIRMAIGEVAPGVARIEDFNDTRSTYAEVAAVIERAKQLAAQSVARALPAPAPVAEILPPQQPSAALSRALPVPVTRTVVRYREPRMPRPSLVGWLLD
ncbi:MAG: hypothetical protein ABSC06_25480 [Rhodopila sp.]|jgi:hypothetical protein